MNVPGGETVIDRFLALDGADADAECARRVAAQWHFPQTHVPEFRGYRFAGRARMLGVRESRRIVCDAMLTEHDLLAGLSRQTHDDIIAIADHPRDRHSPSGGEARGAGRTSDGLLGRRSAGDAHFGHGCRNPPGGARNEGTGRPGRGRGQPRARR